MAVSVEATDLSRPFVVARNGNVIVLSRRSTQNRAHNIAFTATELIAVTNALVDAAEQLEQDNN